MDPITLQQGFQWVLTGGAAGITYYIMEKSKKLKALPPEPKRYVAWAIAGGFAAAAYGGMVLWGWQTEPVGWLAWIESLFPYVLTAALGADTLHARFQLSKKRRRG